MGRSVREKGQEETRGRREEGNRKEDGGGIELSEQEIEDEDRDYNIGKSSTQNNKKKITHGEQAFAMSK